MRIIFSGLIFFLMMMFSGCSHIDLKVEPQVKMQKLEQNLIVDTNITYDGNREYLPTVLKHDENSQSNSIYEYEVEYINGSTKMDVINIWNPLLIVGFPMGSEAVIVQGKLIYRNANQIENVFTASCIAKKTRNLFQNSSSTEPRRNCLLAVRDNIDIQVIHFIQGGVDASK